VHMPGYMVNYGLGSVLTADLRQHIRDVLGSFETGNPQWFSWISDHLLRFGEEIETAALLQQFLGRPVSPQALLDQIRRIAVNQDQAEPKPRLSKLNHTNTTVRRPTVALISQNGVRNPSGLR